MTRQRTAFLAGAGVLLSVVGILLLWRGASHGPTWLTVSGIVVTLCGLVGLRIVYWSLRVRRMTELGSSFRVLGPDEDRHTDDPGPSRSDGPE
jgi:uncharacterized membrane protein